MAEPLPEQDPVSRLIHELRNTLFATDMLLERALERAESPAESLQDVRRAHEGVKESLEVLRRAYRISEEGRSSEPGTKPG